MMPGRTANAVLRAVAAALILTVVSVGTSRVCSAQDFGIPPNTVTIPALPDYARLMVPERGRPVTLRLTNGEVIRGRVGMPESSQFVLEMGEQSFMAARVGISWVQISEVRVDRRSAWLEGVAMGGLGGALTGYLSPETGTPDRTHLGLTAPARVWNAALQGAVIGAAAGLLRGLDLVLHHREEGTGLAGPADPTRRFARPSNRLVQTSPTTSLTLRDMERSLAASALLPPGPRPDPALGEIWNGRPGAGLAWETSFPLDRSWWLRNRVEWSVLGEVTQRSGPEADPAGGTATYELKREYASWRWTAGFVLPIGPVKRLPVAELAFMAGLERAAITSSAARIVEGGAGTEWRVGSSQKEWRPVLLAGASLTVVRRPDLSVAVRMDAVMGPGFRTNALYEPGGSIVLPRHRVTPIGVSVGFELLFPNF